MQAPKPECPDCGSGKVKLVYSRFDKSVLVAPDADLPSQPVAHLVFACECGLEFSQVVAVTPWAKAIDVEL